MWLASSTHAGEEDIVGHVHASLESQHPGLLTVIVPRHPQRGPEIARALSESGLNVALRSLQAPLTDQTQIYVADTLGELGLFYRLAEVVFVGRSLVPLGGQNPLEPARLDCAVLYGPHTTNFDEISRLLGEAHAARVVEDERALATAVDQLLSNAPERHRLAAAAREFAADKASVLDVVLAGLSPYLSENLAPYLNENLGEKKHASP